MIVKYDRDLAKALNREILGLVAHGCSHIQVNNKEYIVAHGCSHIQVNNKKYFVAHLYSQDTLLNILWLLSHIVMNTFQTFSA